MANVSVPAAPAQAVNVSEWFGAVKVASKPGLAFVIGASNWNGGFNTMGGLLVLSTSNAASPVIVGSLTDPVLTFSGLAVSGNYAYMGCGANGLIVADISNPAAPRFVGTNDTPGYAQGVSVVGNLVYVADGLPGGLRIIDVSNPRLPVSVGWVDTPGNAHAVAVSGNYAYVADHYTLQVADVSSPSNPRLIGSLAIGAQELSVAGTLVCVANAGSGFTTVDVSDPAHPVQMGHVEALGDAYASTLGICQVGTTAYVANYSGGLTVIDVSNPAAPSVRASMLTAGKVHGVTVRDGFAYAADSLGGLDVIHVGP